MDDHRPLFWLSFANDDGFLGAVLLRAQDEIDAVRQAHAKGINPGGEVCIVKPEVPTPTCLEEKYSNRLLSKAECGQFDKALSAALAPISHLLEDKPQV